MSASPDLAVTLGSLRLKNPVLTASGTFGFGQEWEDFYDLSILGGIMVKAVTVLPRDGNAMPRMCETPAGTLNSIGLQNPGLEAFLDEKLPYLRQFDTAVIVNIAADREDEYEVLAERLSAAEGVHAIEMNISCPNQDQGGIEFGIDPCLTEAVVARVRAKTNLPLVVKLSPNVTDIAELARAAEAGGADILSLVNTFVGTSIDVRSRAFKLARGRGGLSGPCIRPLAVYMTHRVAQAVKLPLIGMGGICDWKDAAEFLLAGASAVAVGTANFVNPMAAAQIVEGLGDYLGELGVTCLTEIVGSARLP